MHIGTDGAPRRLEGVGAGSDHAAVQDRAGDRRKPTEADLGCRSDVADRIPAVARAALGKRAVSEEPISSAIYSMDFAGNSSSVTTAPAGLPPSGRSVNAAPLLDIGGVDLAARQPLLVELQRPGPALALVGTGQILQPAPGTRARVARRRP